MQSRSIQRSSRPTWSVLANRCFIKVPAVGTTLTGRQGAPITADAKKALANQEPSTHGTKRTYSIAAAMSVNDPNVWTGRASQECFGYGEVGLALIYPACLWSLCSGP